MAIPDESVNSGYPPEGRTATAHPFVGWLFLLFIFTGTFSYWPAALGLAGRFPILDYTDEVACLALVALITSAIRTNAATLQFALVLLAGVFLLLTRLIYDWTCTPVKHVVLVYGTITYLLMILSAGFSLARLRMETIVLVFRATVSFLVIAAVGLAYDFATGRFLALEAGSETDQSVRNLSVLLDQTVRPSFLFVSTTNASALVVAAVGVLLVSFSVVRTGKATFLVGVAASVVAVSLTLVRTGYVLLVIEFVLWYFVYNRLRVGLLIGCILTAVLLCITVSLAPEGSLLGKIGERSSVIFGARAKDESSNQLRNSYWRDGLRHISTGFPGGEGLGVSNPKSRNVIEVKHFESSVLGFVNETGAIGVFAFVSIYLSLGVLHINRWGRNGVGMLVLNTAVPIMQMATVPMASNYTLIVLYGMSMCIGFQAEKNRS